MPFGLLRMLTSTEVQNHFGRCLQESIRAPIGIARSGTPTAVLMAYDMYERLQEMETKVLELRALEAEHEGFVGTERAHEALGLDAPSNVKPGAKAI